jgi:hypothetical protein
MANQNTKLVGYLVGQINLFQQTLKGNNLSESEINDIKGNLEWLKFQLELLTTENIDVLYNQISYLNNRAEELKELQYS